MPIWALDIEAIFDLEEQRCGSGSAFMVLDQTKCQAVLWLLMLFTQPALDTGGASTSQLFTRPAPSLGGEIMHGVMPAFELRAYCAKCL